MNFLLQDNVFLSKGRTARYDTREDSSSKLSWG